MGVEHRQHKYTCDVCGAQEESLSLPYGWLYFMVATSRDPKGTFHIHTHNPASPALACKTCSDYPYWDAGNVGQFARNLNIIKHFFNKLKGK